MGEVRLGTDVGMKHTGAEQVFSMPSCQCSLILSHSVLCHSSSWSFPLILLFISSEMKPPFLCASFATEYMHECLQI